MPIQNVTKKRAGKATKRKKSSASKTMAIRAMRAAFFLIIGLFIVYVYFLYENGSLIENMKALNISVLFISGLTAIKTHPIIILFLLIYGGTFLWIGYRLGIKRS
jgi:ABC-type methionine transport system permease subunit